MPWRRGIYDQIGGGFARYSTDERWLVPHFEKMLYDNALLTRTYLEAYQVTGDTGYRRVATETLDYVLREMTSPEGGFCSASDADSEGEEGKFFVWTPDEIHQAVPDADEARRFCAFFDITPEGNWEHASIPNRPRSIDEVARDLGITPDELRCTIERARPLVYAARLKRVPPGLDDKILTAWNGMMLSAMAEGARVLADARYLHAAQQAANFLLNSLSRPDGGLYRTYRAGKAHLHGCLEDYAFLAEGLTDLYEAGGRERYLIEATRLAERILTDFSDPEQGGFFTTAKDHESLILRSREGPDGATPSGNAVAAAALARLSFHYAREDFRDAATRAIRVYGRQMARYPRAFAKSLIVADLLLNGPVELALVGTPGESGYDSLRDEVARHFLPNRVLAHHNPTESETRHPLLAGKGLVGGQAALYLCRNFACQAPFTEPTALTAALAGAPLGTNDQASQPRALAGTRLAGCATPGGTGAYAARALGNQLTPKNAAFAYHPLGSTGLTTSRLGFGGYRIDSDEPEYRDALMKALREGCNLIDTSTNYTDGDSERLIGSVVGELIRKGELRREEMILVSKIGYVQGENLKRAQAREQAGTPYPEMVKYGDGIWHCLHPEFLAVQLDRSLDRLEIETLDICLLHNPEYFLSDAVHRGAGDLDQLRARFDERLEKAFAYFEAQVAAGRLRYYGVSSNTCTAEPTDPEATSLSRMLEAAKAAAVRAGRTTHHFRILQCPMNLFEAGALLTPNTGPDRTQTVLELAGKEGIAILVNRPLNAMPRKDRGGMIRLAEPPADAPAVPFEAQQERVAHLEEEYRRDLAPQIRHGGQGLAPAEYFRWAEELLRIRPLVQNLEHWEQIEGQMIAPHLNQVLRALAQHLTGETGDRWQAWRERYLPQLLALLEEMRREAARKSRENTNAIARAIDPLLPEERRRETLSRKALWVLASTPGVTCVLNGMRTRAYVEDSLGILGWAPLPDARRIYAAVKQLS